MEKEEKYTEAQETCLSMMRDQQDFLLDLSKGWASVDKEMLECLQDFDCIDDDYCLTEHGKEVIVQLNAGFGR